MELMVKLQQCCMKIIYLHLVKLLYLLIKLCNSGELLGFLMQVLHLKTNHSPVIKWTSPPNSTIKCTANVVVDTNEIGIGLGWVVHDHA